MAEMYPLTALWAQVSKRTGKTYWTGKFGEARILMFPSKSDNPRAPAFKIFITEHVSPEERERREAEKGPPGPVVDFPEIPF